MRILGFEINRRKDYAVSDQSSNVFGTILEPFAGAWQRNITSESRRNLLAFSAVYACISLRSEDIGKLRCRLMEYSDGTQVWSEVTRTNPFAAVLLKPNAYQTRQQFFTQWELWKLLYGNFYALKERDARGIVVNMYPLDPRYVTPLVADDGSVFYELRQDYLANTPEGVRVPSSEIIHDRCITPFHPLIGVSPIYACGASATQGIRIQANSEAFFANMSRPSGQLTSPNPITAAMAKQLKVDFETNFGGGNLGRLLVTGNGLQYQAMTIPADDAQLIEQLRFTVEDVARTFRVPLHKLAAGPAPSLPNLGALNQDYYAQALQPDIEAIEALLDEGLNLHKVRDKTYGVEFDLEGLLRTDPLTRADTMEKRARAGVYAPNEQRRSENLEPVPGGESPYLQQQNYSLAALAKRDAQDDPFGPKNPPPQPALPAPAEGDKPNADDSDDGDDETTPPEKVAEVLFNEIHKLRQEVAHMATAREKTDEAAALALSLSKRFIAEAQSEYVAA